MRNENPIANAAVLVPPARGADAKHGGKTVVFPISLFAPEPPSPLSLRDIPPFGGNF
jgi:hypothetical protein